MATTPRTRNGGVVEEMIQYVAPVEEEVVHLYTITANTLLYKLLYTLWRNKRLDRAGPKPSEDLPTRIPTTATAPSSLEEGFWQLKAELLGAQSLYQRYLLVRELNSGLAKLARIKILFWQDGSLVTVLRSLLSQYLAGQHRNFINAADHDHYRKVSSSDIHRDMLNQSEGNMSVSQEQRQEQLEMCVLLYDTLTLSFTGSHHHMMKVVSSHDYKVAGSLLSCLLTPVTVPPAIRLTCDRWLTDTTSYNQDTWDNLLHAPLVQLVAQCVQLATVAAHQLLQAALEETTAPPQLSALLRYCHLKPWLRYAVPQILGAVRGECRSGEGVVQVAPLLHQYLALLSLLLENSSKARRFCNRQYREELRYFITESNVRQQLQDEHSLLVLCQTLVESIRDSLGF